MPFSPFDDRPFRGMTKVATTYGVLLVGNLAAWAWAWIAFADRPALLGTAFLAYVFGLRHAFDADHIAAIDNVVRKLMQEGKAPFTVGFFFSLGHSTIVVLASVAIAATRGRAAGPARRAPRRRRRHRHAGLGALPAAHRHRQPVHPARHLGGVHAGPARRKRSATMSSTRCWPAAACWPACSARCSASCRARWHMYPIGFLFGLGFDTATEIGLLGISATQAAQGMPFWTILVFPGAVHRRHVAGRHHRQRADGRRLWLGLRQADPQALVQPDHHRRVGGRRHLHRRHRGAWA